MVLKLRVGNSAKTSSSCDCRVQIARKTVGGGVMSHIINPEWRIQGSRISETGNWSLWQISVGFSSCRISEYIRFHLFRTLELLEPFFLPLVLKEVE